MKSTVHQHAGVKQSKRAATAFGTAEGDNAASAAKKKAAYHEQLTEDRVSKLDVNGPGIDPAGALSSANSVSADPFARQKSLGAPVPQVTRHI